MQDDPTLANEFPRNVFVLCTGRCGSTTFARACKFLSGWTAGHESRTHLLGPDRLAYPKSHIEADNRLSWLLGRLEATWGDRAAYVHLTRNREEVARSYAARAGQGIIRAYRADMLLNLTARKPDTPILDVCLDYVDTVTANIESFLRRRRHVLPMRLETIRDDFDTFLGWIDAQGDLKAARAELGRRHNATKVVPSKSRDPDPDGDASTPPSGGTGVTTPD